MSRLSQKMLDLWDEDPDAGFNLDSPFNSWWLSTIKKSAESSTSDIYRACLYALNEALFNTLRATQMEIYYAPVGLRYLAEAMYLLRRCYDRKAPSSVSAFDLEDIDQASLLIAFQFDAVFGTPDCTLRLEQWFSRSLQEVRGTIQVGARPEIIQHAVDEGEVIDLEILDDIHWVIMVLNWFKREDPERVIGVDTATYLLAIEKLETDLRLVLPNLRLAKEVENKPLSPISFWWRH